MFGFSSMVPMTTSVQAGGSVIAVRCVMLVAGGAADYIAPSLVAVFDSCSILFFLCARVRIGGILVCIPLLM